MKDASSVSIRELRRFGLLLGALIAGLLGVAPMLLRHHVHLWPWPVAGILWMMALATPAALAPIRRGWIRVGRALGWVNQRVILTAVYLVFIVPLAMLMKVLGRDRIGRRFDPALTSYRVASTPRPPRSIEKPY
ncbi:MAG TPA: SxtJ family membrane protein [Candidatus Binataceae bacterium]|nr:SxtJ family membrane protein [Candidatus Binataceae bacterium]